MPAVEPAWAAVEDGAPAVGWALGATQWSSVSSALAAEPPAPDAEPAVEWAASSPAPPPEPPAPDPGSAAPPPEPPAPDSGSPPPPAEPPAPDAEPAVELAAPGAAVKAGGPRIVPAARPPARGLVVGSARREYPLLRGAIVKLAHDDPSTAARLLAALLPACGAAIREPLSFDVTIRDAGTFGVAIADGRASVERLQRPRPRGRADFHLTGDPLVLAELLAGVEHRIGRFLGPVRFRGRRRRLKALRALRASTVGLVDAARAGARLDPELVYRTFAYAVHPSWTRGHSFTIAQAITGEPPETWYFLVRDGGGLAVSSTPPATVPDATVSMTRGTFDRLVRGEPLASGERPTVRGDHEAVALMNAWTRRAQGAPA